MTVLTTAEKAPILLDGVPVEGASQIIPSSNSFEVQSFGTPAHPYVVAVSVDPAASVIVRKGGREGVAHFSIVEAPLDVSLGAPEPK